MAKKLFIKSYGCQMNVYDAARMADVLAPHGYVPASAVEDADMVILNTCHIREKAAEKIYSELGRLRRLKRQRSKAATGRGDMTIAVGGCVAQAEGEEILRRAPHVDIAFGPQTYHRLPEMIARADRHGPAVLDTEFPAEPKFDHLPARSAPGPAALLTVQEGCDKFCAFCVVPYTRGTEYSRPAADIIAEAGRLVADGAREITLLGQNVNAYHGVAPGGRVPWGLGRLILALSELGGLQRIRYTTSHPRDMDDELIAAHGEIEKLMPYLHLPVQAGSDRVLVAMNRGHRIDDYRRVIERLREARPDIALSSDFIVGHPGETDADFEATLRLVGEIGFAQAYSFKYSARPGTPASVMRGQVAETVKADRLAALQHLLNAQQRAFNAASVGRTIPVLFEGRAARPGQVAGRSPHMQAVHAACEPDQMVAVIGKTIEVKVTDAHANSLTARLLRPRSPQRANLVEKAPV